MTCTPEELERFSAIARDEIGETEANIPEDVEKVKKLLVEKYSDLRLPSDSDNLLGRCLRYRKFDVAQAANQVHLYFKLLSNLHQLHKDMYLLPSLLQDHYYEPFGIAVLKNRDSKGRVVVILDYEKLPIRTYNFEKGLAATFILLDQLVEMSVDNQRLGIVFLCSYKGYGFSHAKEFASFSRIRAIVRTFQGSFPVRYKELHLIKCPAIFSSTYKLLIPFFGEKLKKRTQIHGSDLTEFHKHIGTDILPVGFGGKLSNEDAFDIEFTRQLSTKDKYYKGLLQYGYTKSKG